MDKIDIVSNDNVTYTISNIKDSSYLKSIIELEECKTIRSEVITINVNFHSDIIKQLVKYLEKDILPKKITSELITLSDFLILPSLIKDIAKRLKPYTETLIS